MDRVAVLAEGQRQSLMRMVLASLSLCLALGGCASFKDKCVNIWIGDKARADVVIGPWASIHLNGPAQMRTVPKDMKVSDCGPLLEGKAP